jgi:hypothetical protein
MLTLARLPAEVNECRRLMRAGILGP